MGRWRPDLSSSLTGQSRRKSFWVTRRQWSSDCRIQSFLRFRLSCQSPHLCPGVSPQVSPALPPRGVLPPPQFSPQTSVWVPPPPRCTQSLDTGGNKTTSSTDATDKTQIRIHKKLNSSWFIIIICKRKSYMGDRLTERLLERLPQTWPTQYFRPFEVAAVSLHGHQLLSVLESPLHLELQLPVVPLLLLVLRHWPLHAGLAQGEIDLCQIRDRDGKLNRRI